MKHARVLRFLGASLIAISLPLAAQGRASSAAGALYDTNLIVNGNAETVAPSEAANPTVTPAGWHVDGSLTAIKYGAGGVPVLQDPGPADRGKRLFAGGTGTNGKNVQTAFQQIDVSGAAADLNTGKVQFVLSGWLGGYADQNDNARLIAAFMDAGGKVLGSATIGPVLAKERHNLTGFLPHSLTGHVSPGTRAIKVTLIMTRTDGSYNDGYADNLSLGLKAPAADTTPVASACGSAKPTSSAVTLVVPANLAVVPSGSALALAWKAAPCAVYYNLQVWLLSAAAGQTPATGSISVASLRLSGNSYSLATSGWLKGTYSWRVAAADAQASVIGKWSPEGAFIIK